MAKIEAMIRQAAAAQDRVAKLEKALKPFADMAADIKGNGNAAVIHKCGSSNGITVGHLREARRILGEPPK